MVAEEVGHRAVGHPPAEHGSRHRRAAVQRVGPVLDPDVTAEQGMVRVRHVAGREHVGRGSVQPRVDDDPIADIQPRCRGEAGGRHRPDPHHHEVGGQHRPGRGDRLGHRAAGAAQFGHRLLEPEPHAVLGVQVGEHRTQFRPKVTVQRPWLRLDHRDRTAKFPGGGGHLEADPARADDHHLAAAAQRRA